MNIDGISLHPLCLELSQAIAGARIDRINQPSKQTVVMALRQPGRNLLLNISINPQNPAAYLIDRAPENPPEPHTFCMVLRKHLEGGRIADIKQYGLDRILSMDVDFLAGDGSIVTKTLIIELIGKYSNIILVKDNVIVEALRRVGQNSSRVRTVLPGDAYVFPPQQEKLNILETPAAELTAAVQKQQGCKLHKAVLNVCLGFGPVTTREAVYRAGLSASAPAALLEAKECAALTASLEEIQSSCRNFCGEANIALDENCKPVALAAFPLKHLTDSASLVSFDSISAMLHKTSALIGSYQPPEKDRLRKIIKNEYNRATAKLDKLHEDLSASEKAEDYRIKADNLMTYQYKFTDRRDAVITVPNIYAENSAPIAIIMDQRLTIAENIQAYYKKYDKLKRGKILLEQQAAKCQANIEYLASIEASLETSTALGDVNEIKAELISSGILLEKPKKHAAEQKPQPMKFTASDGTVILVGKNNYQNDRLTFKTAAPNDIWLHTKDIPGSHVIIRTEGSQPSEDTLLLASYLAVHFSKAKGSAKVPVDYTLAKYVKKTSGAKPGFVIFTNQSTLYVTPEDDVLNPVLLQNIQG